MQIVNVNNAGKQFAKPGSEIKVGDVLVHSYGELSDVVEFVKETATTVVFVIQERTKTHRHPEGYRCEKRFNKTALQPVKVNQ